MILTPTEHTDLLNGSDNLINTEVIIDTKSKSLTIVKSIKIAIRPFNIRIESNFIKEALKAIRGIKRIIGNF